MVAFSGTVGFRWMGTGFGAKMEFEFELELEPIESATKPLSVRFRTAWSSIMNAIIVLASGRSIFKR